MKYHFPNIKSRLLCDSCCDRIIKSLVRRDLWWSLIQPSSQSTAITNARSGVPQLQNLQGQWLSLLHSCTPLLVKKFLLIHNLNFPKGNFGHCPPLFLLLYQTAVWLCHQCNSPVSSCGLLADHPEATSSPEQTSPALTGPSIPPRPLTTLGALLWSLSSSSACLLNWGVHSWVSSSKQRGTLIPLDLLATLPLLEPILSPYFLKCALPPHAELKIWPVSGAVWIPELLVSAPEVLDFLLTKWTLSHWLTTPEPGGPHHF